MPNHVMNKLVFADRPALLARFEGRVPAHRGLREFDFNTLIPQPPSLDIASGSVTEAGYFAITGEELVTWLEENEPEALELGQAAAANQRQYGHPDWYSWWLNRWDTKWNAYGTEWDRAAGVLRFQTAWAPPEPVLGAMAEKYPDLHGGYACFDEGWNFAGIGAFGFGSFTFAECTPNDVLHEQVYGYRPEHSPAIA